MAVLNISLKNTAPGEQVCRPSCCSAISVAAVNYIAVFLGKSPSVVSQVINAKNIKQTIDEEYFPLVDFVQANKETFNTIDEAARRKLIEEFLNAQ